MSEELFFHFDADLPAHLELDLTRVLGTLRMGQDWRGGRYVDLPAPFDDLRISDGERLRGEKRTRLFTALAYFTAHPVVTV
jgi:hypothetical protein